MEVKAWGQPTPVTPQPPETKAVFPSVPKKKTRRKIRIPQLRTAKRIIAGLLLCLYIVFFMSMLNLPSMLLAFGATIFILFDYLHKTKRARRDWSQPE